MIDLCLIKLDSFFLQVPWPPHISTNDLFGVYVISNRFIVDIFFTERGLQSVGRKEIHAACERFFCIGIQMRSTKSGFKYHLTNYLL